ncbi:hypothetical protein [Sphingomonas sp. Leaf242]|uniref:hypothetical protein n=1 Tax=Sphingomonas sp. Leaf242 TaxID=1736304 RepID=UPI001F441D79|nr:hypothetical protein [Sphingomonas sp. Leaf242]
MFEIRKDDLSGDQTRSLLALHLAGMHDTSPPDNVFALDLTGLQAPEITVWTACVTARLPVLARSRCWPAMALR